MPEMQLFKCLVAIGGDDKMISPPATRGWGQGVVSGPEIEVLRTVHGAGSVRDIAPVEVVDDDGQPIVVQTTTKREKARLCGLYDPKLVEQVFPGQNPQMTLSPSLDEIMDEGTGPDEDEPEPAPARKVKPKVAPQQERDQRLGKTAA